MWPFQFPVWFSGFNTFYASLIYSQPIKSLMLGDHSRLSRATLKTLETAYILGFWGRLKKQLFKKKGLN